jgi:SAM-dependent methyltransferase
MILSAEYSRQYRWRPWDRIYSALPNVQGETILDLGCAVGDQAAELVARGATVIGIDANEELLRVARSRGIGNVEFYSGDIRHLDPAFKADGIWSSFSVAYIPNPQSILESWSQSLRPNGWMAITEIDNLFGHEPLSDRTKTLLGSYEAEALHAGRYDFHMGGKLQAYLEGIGLAIESVLVCEDAELSFTGPATPEIIEAWQARFDRMPLLKSVCGGEFDAVHYEFLACLSMREHRSLAGVYSVVARRGQTSQR